MRSETGATMVEYAMMIGFVVIVAFLAVEVFGDAVRSLFQSSVDVMP
ncbi:MAG: Flp family type IVb pilin [Actinobacteria bacterium]|nr:Flp family type IVb pilin [Actinomycetota bacterium]